MSSNLLYLFHMKETFPQKTLRKNKQRLLIVTLSILVVSIISFLYAVLHVGNLKIPNLTVGIISLTLVSMFTILMHEVFQRVDQYGEQLSKNIENSKRGIEGEELAKEEIPKTIGTDHQAFFNKQLPTGGDIDCLIVGSKGIILVEVKNYSKKVYLPFVWAPGFYDPRQEARKHARKLRRYLISQGLSHDIRIHKAVLYINKNVSFSGKQDVFNILGIDQFQAYFSSRSVDTGLQQSDITRLVRIIEEL